MTNRAARRFVFVVIVFSAFASLFTSPTAGDTLVSPVGFETIEGNSLAVPGTPYPDNGIPPLLSGFRIQDYTQQMHFRPDR